MIINKKIIPITYLYFLFFLLGFGKYIMYIPIAIVYLFLNKNWAIKKNYAVILLLNIIMITFLFLLGFERMIPDPLRLLAVLSFVFLVSSFLIQNQPPEIQTNLLIFYILGIGLEALIIAGYSYLFNEGFYGHGKIYDPLIQQEVNSPVTSNNLAILASFLVFYIFNNRKLIIKSSSIILLLIVVVLAAFLSGRTFFLLLFLAIFYSFINPLTTRKTLFALILLFGSLITISTLDNIVNLDSILHRFESGLESKRFLHYKHGINELISHPFGGYTIDKSIEKTKWFHNIFLDMGRLGGWIPIICYSLLLLYVLIKSYDKVIVTNTKYSLATLMFLTSFLILQQDTSLEGNYRAYIVMILSSIILISNTRTIPLYKKFNPK